MSSGTEQQPPRSRARRHFLGLAGATGAKAAAILAAMATISSSPGQAMGWKVWKGSDKKSIGGNDPNCLLRGTAIMTPSGEMPVEDLRVGDLVETVSGRVMPVKWIGRQSYRKSGPSWQESVVPIRITRNALGENTPHRDLYLSPNHALYIDGVLIRVKELVNGISITPSLPADRQVVEYFNILLETHEAILAEGAPVESFLLKAGNHENFANFAEFEHLYPAKRRVPMTPFAPIVGYEGGCEHLMALLHMGASHVMRLRDPIQDAYEKIGSRTRTLA